MVPVRRSPWGAMRLDSHVDVQQLVEDLADANRAYLDAQPDTPPLYESGVRYQKERPGEEDWLIIPEVRAQGHADCEDLAAWRAAETGGTPIALRTRAGYHIVVRNPDGSYEDPSARLGMGGRPVRLMCGYVETREGVHGVALGRIDGDRAIRAHAFVPYREVEHVSGMFGDIVSAARSVVKNKAFKAIAGTALDVAATVVPGGQVARAALDLAGRAIDGATKSAPPSTSTAPAPAKRAAPAKGGQNLAATMFGWRKDAITQKVAQRGADRGRPAIVPSPGGPNVTGPAGGHGARYTAEYLKAARTFVRMLPRELRTAVVLHLLGRPDAARGLSA